MKELLTMRQEQLVIGHRLDGHEHRIIRLERHTGLPGGRGQGLKRPA